MNAIALIFCFFLLCSAPSTADESSFEVASVYRTELFEPYSRRISPKTPEEIIVVLRLTEISLEIFQEQTFNRKPYTRPVMLVPEGEIETSTFECAGEMRSYKDGLLDWVIKPYIVLIFSVPRTVEGTVKIKIGDLAAVDMQLPESVSAELSSGDIE